MDAFVGKWKVVKGATTGFNDFVAAMEVSPETIEKMKSADNVSLEITKDGDSGFVQTREFGGKTHEAHTFKFNEWVTVDVAGKPNKTLYRLEGDRLLGEHDMAGRKATSVRYIKDGKMAIETTGNGKIMTIFYERA